MSLILKDKSNLVLPRTLDHLQMWLKQQVNLACARALARTPLQRQTTLGVGHKASEIPE